MIGERSLQQKVPPRRAAPPKPQTHFMGSKVLEFRPDLLKAISTARHFSHVVNAISHRVMQAVLKFRF
jgi:hypothetical protein